MASGRLRRGQGHTGEISGLIVSPALRGGGIGLAVLSALVGAGRQQGLASLHAAVPREATRLFARTGFARVEGGLQPQPAEPVARMLLALG